MKKSSSKGRTGRPRPKKAFAVAMSAHYWRAPSTVQAQAKSTGTAMASAVQAVEDLAGGSPPRVRGLMFPPDMPLEWVPGIAAASTLTQCYPCDAHVQIVAVGVLKDKAGPLFYPMCSDCHDDVADHKQRAAFAEVVRRRFILDGEVEE